MSDKFSLANGRPGGGRLKRWFLALLLAGLPASVVLPASVQAGGSAMLQGQVDVAMMQQTFTVIAERQKTVDLASEWRLPDGKLVSGGASELGWLLGDLLRMAHIKVRCTGLCFSSAAHILIASGSCIVSRRGRVALHVPEPIMVAGAGVTAYARARTDLIDAWRRRLASYAVPTDIVDRALMNRDGVHELSTYEMKRIGCEVE